MELQSLISQYFYSHCSVKSLIKSKEFDENQKEVIRVMEIIKKSMMKLLFVLTGNWIALKILEKIFYLTRLLLGLGSGGFPIDSGEVAVVNYLKSKISNRKEKFIIFDVGANKGQFLELLLDNMSCDEFEIFCFEPIQAAYNDLQQKFSALEHAVLENYGLDNIVHKGDIFFDQQASLRSSKFKRDLRHLGIYFSESERVNFTTLDQYCLDNEIESIDLLKIDVEGNEFNVLNGSERMLTKNAICLITFEFGRAQIDSDMFFKDYYYFLTDFGMKHLFRILPNGYLKPIKKYDESNEIFFTTNYLAVMK